MKKEKEEKGNITVYAKAIKHAHTHTHTLHVQCIIPVFWESQISQGRVHQDTVD